MAYKKKKTQEKIHKSSFGERLAGFLILLVIITVIFAAYAVIRRTASRISSDFYYPFLKGIRSAEQSFSDSLLAMENKTTLMKAVLLLRQEKFILTAQQARYQTLAQENIQLRRLLKLPMRNNFKPVFASLLYRDDSRSSTIIKLDKGANDGIRPGCIVVTVVPLEKTRQSIVAVVGRVTEVSNHTSTVATIYDSEFKLSVTFSGVNAVMQDLPGVARPMTGINFIPVTAKIRQGMMVRTSSLTGNAPGGLPVGKIAAIKPRQTGVERDHVYQQTALLPFAAPDQLQFAAVYVKTAPETSTFSHSGSKGKNTKHTGRKNSVKRSKTAQGY